MHHEQQSPCCPPLEFRWQKQCSLIPPLSVSLCIWGVSCKVSQPTQGEILQTLCFPPIPITSHHEDSDPAWGRGTCYRIEVDGPLVKVIRLKRMWGEWTDWHLNKRLRALGATGMAHPIRDDFPQHSDANAPAGNLEHGANSALWAQPVLLPAPGCGYTGYCLTRFQHLWLLATGPHLSLPLHQEGPWTCPFRVALRVLEHVPEQLVFLSDEHFPVLELWNVESAILKFKSQLPLKSLGLSSPLYKEEW